MTDVFSAEKRSWVMARVRGGDTQPERLVRLMLHRLGYRFRLHRKDLPGTPDIVLPKRRTVVFVHGCFWHGHDCSRGGLPASNQEFWAPKIAKNRDRDARAQRELRKNGWKVLTVWQCQTKKVGSLQKKLSRSLERTDTENRAALSQ